jgi:hypothetical protein
MHSRLGVWIASQLYHGKLRLGRDQLVSQLSQVCLEELETSGLVSDLVLVLECLLTCLFNDTLSLAQIILR